MRGFDLDRWEEIVVSMRGKKRRRFVSGLGILWGILMVIWVMGGGKGLEEMVWGEFEGLGRNWGFLGRKKRRKG